MIAQYTRRGNYANFMQLWPLWKAHETSIKKGAVMKAPWSIYVYMFSLKPKIGLGPKAAI